jgi:hypothetical protein
MNHRSEWLRTGRTRDGIEIPAAAGENREPLFLPSLAARECIVICQSILEPQVIIAWK